MKLCVEIDMEDVKCSVYNDFSARYVLKTVWEKLVDSATDCSALCYPSWTEKNGFRYQGSNSPNRNTLENSQEIIHQIM